jgi:hypothetical protein
MRTGLIIFCFFLFITGCKNKNKVPAGVIKQKKMQAVLWDMMRADQFLGDFVLKKDSTLNKKMESIKLYGKVFAIHQISKEQFMKSFSFYKSHPALFKVIMDSLSQPKKMAIDEMMEHPMLPDSIAKTQQKLKDSIFPLRKKKVIPVN